MNDRKIERSDRRCFDRQQFLANAIENFKLLVATRNLQSIKTSLTLELRQLLSLYCKSGSSRNPWINCVEFEFFLVQLKTQKLRTVVSWYPIFVVFFFLEKRDNKIFMWSPGSSTSSNAGWSRAGSLEWWRHSLAVAFLLRLLVALANSSICSAGLGVM